MNLEISTIIKLVNSVCQPIGGSDTYLQLRPCYHPLLHSITMNTPSSHHLHTKGDHYGVLWLLTSPHSDVLAENSREFGVGHPVELHIPFELFLNPLDTVQIPSHFLHTEAVTHVGQSRFLFGGEKGML